MFFRSPSLLDPRTDQETSARALVTYRGGEDGSRVLRFDADGSTHPLAAAMREMSHYVGGTHLGAALIEQAKELGYEIEFDPHRDDSLVQIDTVARRVLFPGYDLSEAAQARSVYFLHECQWNILRALRLIDLAENMRLPRLLRPDQMIKAVRLVAADQIAVSMTLLWAVHQDMPGLWRHVLGGAMSDIAQSFVDGSKKLTGADGSGLLQDALMTWYDDVARVSETDQTTLALLDETLTRAKTPRLYQAQLNPESIRHLCTIAGNRVYVQKDDHHILDMIQGGPDLDVIQARHLKQILNEQDMVMVHNVGFRDAGLARRIFPDA